MKPDPKRPSPIVSPARPLPRRPGEPKVYAPAVDAETAPTAAPAKTKPKAKAKAATSED